LAEEMNATLPSARDLGNESPLAFLPVSDVETDLTAPVVRFLRYTFGRVRIWQELVRRQRDVPAVG